MVSPVRGFTPPRAPLSVAADPLAAPLAPLPVPLSPPLPLPDELVCTADDIYIRFHGIEQWYRHDYSDDELMVWAERINRSGAKTIWAYFNNDRDGHSIKNAKRLAEMLSFAL